MPLKYAIKSELNTCSNKRDNNILLFKHYHERKVKHTLSKGSA